MKNDCAVKKSAFFSIFLPFSLVFSRKNLYFCTVGMRIYLIFDKWRT